MKLPRGTFHSIRKGILFGSLLDEMEKTRFSGYCTISYGIETFTLVLNTGTYILADYDKLEGEPAWQKMQNLLDVKVDGGLTTLNTVQLQLAREFNPHAELPSFIRKSISRQSRTGVTNSGTIKKEHIPGTTVRETPLEHRKNHSPLPVQDKIPEKTHPVPRGSAPIALHYEEQQETENGPEERGTNIERDLEALDGMDIDEMAKKIRENCKVTIEHLDLDYLIENKED